MFVQVKFKILVITSVIIFWCLLTAITPAPARAASGLETLAVFTDTASFKMYIKNVLVATVPFSLGPQFSRNLNTGGSSEMDTNYIRVQQKIYHSTQYPSHLILPLIPE